MARRPFSAPVCSTNGDQTAAREILNVTASSASQTGARALTRAAIEAIIAREMAGHQLSIGRVARTLGVPVRTLQRWLARQGLTFRALVDRVRLGNAINFMEDPGLRMCDIAAALGYSDPSSFSRAFMRWAGVSPETCRRSRLLPAPPVRRRAAANLARNGQTETRRTSRLARDDDRVPGPARTTRSVP